MSSRAPARLLALVLVVFGRPAGAADPRAVPVEPSELASRADLFGKVVAVDDRVRRFQWHRDTDYDEIYLKRTPVVFRLPPRLRFQQAPKAPVVHIEGILSREGDLRVCDVTTVELLPADLERLEQAIALLGPQDAERRAAWARWAERRGTDFKDEALLERGRFFEGEAIRIEAERPSPDPPRRWLELARRARQRHVPEPEPSALAHRALAARLAAADSVDSLQALVQEIKEFLPGSPSPIVAGDQRPADLDAWLAPYANNPASAYRAAPASVRMVLDHRLWGEATQRLIELRMAADPEHALEYAQEASTALADRPQLVTRLLEQGLKQAAAKLETLRQSEVLALARVYRESLHQPAAATLLIRRWLDDQRDRRLSATDAEGRVILADQYDSLLDDRPAAVALLEEAWRIDPQSKEVADAFRRRGYHKLNDRWILSQNGGATSPAPGVGADQPRPADTADPAQSASLRGLTPQQVRARMGGKPDRVVWSAAQGQVVEQWIYHGVNQDQCLNFLHTTGELVPKLVAYYTRPRTRNESGQPR